MSNEQTLPIDWDLTGEDAIMQGADWRREALLTYSDGTIWNTAGYTAFASIRPSYDGPLVMPVMTTENGQIEVGIQRTAPNQCNIAITLTSAATKGLADWGLGVWDIWLKDSTGHEIPIYAGFAVLRRRISP